VRGPDPRIEVLASQPNAAVRAVVQAEDRAVADIGLSVNEESADPGEAAPLRARKRRCGATLMRWESP
jgi:hypothetical protein